MTDYISREAAKNTFPKAEADAFENCRYCTCLDSGQISDILDAVPAADVAPVVHGHNKGYDKSSMFECSVCGWECWDMYSGDGPYNYCPNCGAKMGDADV